MIHPPDLPELISLHGLIVMIGIAVYVAVSHTLHQRRHPSAAIAWVVTLALLPYVGLPLYLLFGTRKLVRREYGPPRATGVGSTEAEWPQRLAAAMDLAPAASYRSLRIHENGEQALRALWEQIDAAERTLPRETQSSKSPQDGDRRRFMVVVRRAQSDGAILRRRAGRDALERPLVRSPRCSGGAGDRAFRARLELCDGRARRQAGGATGNGISRDGAADSIGPRSVRRYPVCASGDGLFQRARAHRGGDALFRARQFPAHGLDARGAAQRGGESHHAGKIEPPPGGSGAPAGFAGARGRRRP